MNLSGWLYGPKPRLRAIVVLLYLIVVSAFVVERVQGVNVHADPPVIATVTAIEGTQTSGCLPRVDRGESELEICWLAYPTTIVDSFSSTSDYYALEITATAHGVGPIGIRWATVEADVQSPDQTTQESAGTTLMLPTGACQELPFLEDPGSVNRDVLACEKDDVVGGDAHAWNRWACNLCLTGIVGDRDLSVVQLVESSQPPTWDIRADLGG